jgi:hypothetical protein
MVANNNQLERRLWAAVDEPRASSKPKSSEYNPRAGGGAVAVLNIDIGGLNQ